MRSSLAFLTACASATLFVHAADPPAPAPPQPARAKLAATAQRNENVAIWEIDNNAVKEANVRVGTRPTISQFNLIGSNYYAVEHGQPPAEVLFVPATPAGRASTWHADLYENLQNSVFNARTFFQVGGVKPSRRNHYGFRASGEVWRLGFLTVTGFQRRIQGMVNGNVLVPLASERTPLTTDPATRAIVQRYLDAYPNQLPNRLDFDPRALNTNAPQRIDEIDGTIRLDRGPLNATWTTNRSRTDAFQLVAGQNPDTSIHATRAKLAWRKSLNPATDLVLGAGFTRVRSDLLPEPNAVGPRVRFGYQIEELGPDSQFPVDRALNTFRYGAQAAHRRGAHTLTFGGDVTRIQLNGVESNNPRGLIQFSNNFGRTALENLHFGTPTMYEVTVGDLSRGYRNWTGALYAADQWKLSSTFQLTLGLRWSMDTTPVEIRQREKLPYGCDCNNVSPRVSLAWNLPGKWVLRAAGTVAFSSIQPVTYQQIRNNTPLVHYIQIQNPNLANPIAGINFADPGLRVSPTTLSRDLTSPYSTQYNLTVEHRLGSYNLRLGYLGSRSYKMMTSFITNRAIPIAGIPLTTATIDQRRPDQRYYEIRNIANGGNAWFDAGIATLEIPLRYGLMASATYIFSKALDDGADFTTTAANRDLLSKRAQSEFNNFPDRHSLSDFDSSHSLSLDYSYTIPGGRNAFTRGWQISGATLLKTGTPLTLFIGSDGPGFGNVDGSPSERPSIIDASILGKTIGDPNTAPQIINRSRFDFIHPGELRGNLGRNTFRKAPIRNANAAITKPFTFHAGHREWSTVFRAEAWNLTNTPQFDEPQRNLSSPSFGRITNTLNDGRIFQLSLRLLL